ncbi:hypothetical protein ACK3TF_004614 [Chlorella vulgaris]
MAALAATEISNPWRPYDAYRRDEHPAVHIVAMMRYWVRAFAALCRISCEVEKFCTLNVDDMADMAAKHMIDEASGRPLKTLTCESLQHVLGFKVADFQKYVPVFTHKSAMRITQGDSY